MARAYGRIITAIWRDKDFRRLRGGAQRVFLLLVTQPDITAAGVLALTVRRWADMDADTTVEQFDSYLDELSAHRFVVIDRDTEELLVRSFVRWDGGHGNTKRRPVILREADEVSSPGLRRALAAEFARLGLPIGPHLDTPSDAVSDGLPDAVSDGLPDTPSSESDKTGKAQVDSPSDTASDTQCQISGVVVTEVGTREPTTHNPQPRNPQPPAPASLAPPAGAAAPTTAQTIVAEWIDRCAKRPPATVIGQISKHVKAMLAEGIDSDDIRRGLAAWMGKDLHPSVLPSLVNSAMNGTRASPPTLHPTDAAIAHLLTPNQRQLPGGNP